MRISIDLFRDILIDIADHDDSFDLNCANLVYDEISQKAINYHVRLLFEEGYINAIDASDKFGYDYCCLELTLAGQLFLDKIENETIWNKTKSLIAKGASVTSIASIEQLVGTILK
ncbi:MAG: DUF2513 domain-containing protein [Acidaminococcaceae bacterium]